MLRTFGPVFTLGGLALAAVVVAGCGQSETPSPQASDEHAMPSPHAAGDEAHNEGTDHAHAPGAHGGTIVPIGRESYHAEVVFENGGKVRLFTLGADESKVQEVDAQTVVAYAKAVGGSDSTQIELKPEALADDAEGKTSQFVAQLPEALIGQQVEVTIPSLRIGGERFRLGFSSPQGAHDEHADEAMPEKTTDAEEASLYLTAGGLYTEADIIANGKMTASQRFKGVKAAHDLNPKPGEKICPITLTKANPKFTWVVAGKPYEFCCPPCVDEFVRIAKETPDEIKSPDSYVRQ